MTWPVALVVVVVILTVASLIAFFGYLFHLQDMK